MQKITDKGLSLIMACEGFSPVIYRCAGGYDTIGYGHVVQEGEDFSNGIDRVWAKELLRRDVQIAQRAVLRLIDVPLNDGQYDALVSFRLIWVVVRCSDLHYDVRSIAVLMNRFRLSLGGGFGPVGGD